MFHTSLENRPSYTWRSLLGVMHVVLHGSRWLVGDGHMLSVWKDRWMPRLNSFKPINLRQAPRPSLRWTILLTNDFACWRERLIWHIFFCCDAELILNTPFIALGRWINSSATTTHKASSLSNPHITCLSLTSRWKTVSFIKGQLFMESYLAL